MLVSNKKKLFLRPSLICFKNKNKNLHASSVFKKVVEKHFSLFLIA